MCFIFIAEEVERLLKDYKQNQDFIRNLGSRFYQIIYPIQVRQRERFGVSTREIEGSYGKVSDVMPIFWRSSKVYTFLEYAVIKCYQPTIKSFSSQIF